jgi:hypothetical protein
MLHRLAVIAVLVAVSGVYAEEKSVKSKQGNYAHIVIITLKKDAPKVAADTMIGDVYKLLAKIPSVRRVQAGKPAEMSSPKFVVKDYDVALMVQFDDFAGNEAYHKHPLHDQFVERNLKNIDKVLVYDFEAGK